MSKKIVSALLMILVIFSGTMTAFCDSAVVEEAVSVTAASYDDAEKKITLTIKNTGSEDIEDSALIFNYDESKVTINNYQGGLMTGAMAMGEERTVLLSADIKDYNGTLPQMGFVFQYIADDGGVIDLTQDMSQSVKVVVVEDMFAQTATEDSSFFSAIAAFCLTPALL